MRPPRGQGGPPPGEQERAGGAAGPRGRPPAESRGDDGRGEGRQRPRAATPQAACHTD
jgi:hypothetical protein